MYKLYVNINISYKNNIYYNKYICANKNEKQNSSTNLS